MWFIIALANYLSEKHICMAKKTVIRLTEGQLAEIIKDITIKSLNEIDGATYSRVYNASHRAKNDKQNGQLQRTVGNRTRNNDDILAHARELEPRAKENFLNPFVNQPFKFYSENRLGIIADVIFTMTDMTHLNSDRAILVGTVVFNDTQINGDGIIVDLKNDKVYYHERGNRYKYVLEIDNRTKDLWDKFMSLLHLAISTRN